ncbi:UPF0496 protein At4g34320 [Capsella rubella]|uniref:UPF0496 protein At4g34320 n=1 Tax=Capsella rubella TaxID=81985 RepID=UPI000CD5168B|nr:UPF0496 protein At4g34320 [Capsella rubella]
MGNRTSKHSKTSLRIYARELRTYEAACEEDKEIQSFDKRMQARTSDVINTLATGVEVRGVSLDSLKVVTESLLDMNQEVVKVMLDCKKDIWKDKEMFKLVEDYFETSMKTHDFCDALRKGLHRIRDSYHMIVSALRQFEEESPVQGGNGYKKTLEKLKKFKDAERPFGEDFVDMFQIAYKQQMLMLEKLQLHNYKLEKKLKRIRTWRKLTSIIFVAAYAAVFICCIVAAAMTASPLVEVLAATAVPVSGIAGKWIDSLWKKYENEIKGQRDVVSSMQAGTYVAVKEMDIVRFLTEQLDNEIRNLVKSAEYAVEHGAVKIRIHEINEMLLVFKKNIEELETQADLSDSCNRDIRIARAVILQRIIKHPNINASIVAATETHTNSKK